MEFGVSGRTAFLIRESTLWIGIVLAYMFFKTNSILWFVLFVLDIALHFVLSFLDYCTVSVYMSDELRKDFNESVKKHVCNYKSTTGLKSCVDCKMYGKTCDGDDEMCEDGEDESSSCKY